MIGKISLIVYQKSLEIALVEIPRFLGKEGGKGENREF